MFVYHNHEYGAWFFALWAVFPFVFLVCLMIRARFPNWLTNGTWVKQLARRQWLAMGLLFVIVLAANVLLALICYPQPEIHDEFVYQLAADTYASGKLTNPTHPHWKHFETFHTLSEPTYMAKYPPGSGLVLGLGQWLTGHSLAGFWVTLAAGVAALYWALSAWMPGRWAFFGCLLIAINPYWLTNWGQTWWGGAVPFLAGTLLFGSTKRLIDRLEELSTIRSVQYSTLFAIAASMLAISRPFEGFIACVICIVVLSWKMFFNWSEASKRIVPLFLPAAIIGSAALAFIGWNNNAVTGDIFKLPYSLHSQRYSASTMWLFADAPPVPEYRLPRMRDYYVNWSRARHQSGQTLQGFLDLASRKIRHCFQFYPLLGGICLVPLLFVRRRDESWIWFCILVLAGLIGLHLLTSFSSVFPHYVAPFAVLFYVLAFEGLRRWRLISRKYPMANYVMPAVVCWSVFRFVFLIAFTIGQNGASTPRSEVESQLSAFGGDHLVFVMYPDGHSPHEEWVFNRADIDSSRIVWAHSLGAAEDQQLIDYFRDQDRRVWTWNAFDDAVPFESKGEQ